MRGKIERKKGGGRGDECISSAGPPCSFRVTLHEAAEHRGCIQLIKPNELQVSAERPTQRPTSPAVSDLRTAQRPPPPSRRSTSDLTKHKADALAPEPSKTSGELLEGTGSFEGALVKVTTVTRNIFIFSFARAASGCINNGTSQLVHCIFNPLFTASSRSAHFETFSCCKEVTFKNWSVVPDTCCLSVHSESCYF